MLNMCFRRENVLSGKIKEKRYTTCSIYGEKMATSFISKVPHSAGHVCFNISTRLHTSKAYRKGEYEDINTVV